jgi:hypothetical protein
MNVTRSLRLVTHAACAALKPSAVAVTLVASVATSVTAQAPAPVAKLVAEPAAITIKAGQTLPFRVRAYDASGKEIKGAAFRVMAGNRAVRFTDSTVTVTSAGKFDATAMAQGANGTAVTLPITVTASWPALAKLEIIPAEGKLYTGLTLGSTLKGAHADGSDRPGVTAAWKSSAPAIASVNRFGDVTAIKAGTVTISAEVEGIKASKTYTVVANPVTTIALDIKESSIRTGDVVHLTGLAKSAAGTTVTDAPITWSYTYTPDDSLVSGGVEGGPGIIRFGRFAPNYPGRYTILASSGSAHAQTAIQVTPRDVRQRISVQGRGSIQDQHTSDLWPWTGKDGRDYVLVGTWGNDGYALVFDITDMSNIKKTDSVKVDARTINDVTVSPDGRYGVLSREGASNRVNGVVILDLKNPAHPTVASTFDQELTGGVHNMFATNDYLFAISGGAKYVIIDVKDIYKPKYVSEYRHPNARIHDLWVNDGIAYAAQGGVGVTVVDVGNGKYGGSIEKPKLITVYPVQSGHEIFPYFQKKTGKTYLFIGDEEMSRKGRVWEGTQYGLSGPDGKPPKGGIAQTSGGYTHIIDFTDPFKPLPVARYHLEDYGTHDIIVQDDVLYQAYYDGGVRIVDVSGELMGNLVDQGREIAVFKSYDPDGYTANAPFVMNAMPWKGKILFTDFNSGLWAAKLEPKPVVP